MMRKNMKNTLSMKEAIYAQVMRIKKWVVENWSSPEIVDTPKG